MPIRNSTHLPAQGRAPLAPGLVGRQEPLRTPKSEAASTTKPKDSDDTLADLRAECEELRRRLAIVPRATQNAAIQISELEKALTSIRQARDSMLAQVHGLTTKLDVAEGRIDELIQEQERIQKGADIAQAVLETTETECAELRGLLRTNEQHHAQTIAELEARLQKKQSQPSDTTQEKRLTEQLNAAQTKVASLEAYFQQVQQQQKQTNSTLIERAIKADRDRRAAETTADAAKRELEEQISQSDALRREIAEMQAQVTTMHAEVSRLGEGRDQAAQLEAQRQQIAELSAQLDTAREETRLAWAVTMGIRDINAGVGEEELAIPDDSIPKPLEAAEARALLEGMTKKLSSCASHPDPVDTLEVLRLELKDFAQRSLCAGSMVTYRMIGICCEVVEWLQMNPTKVKVMQDSLKEAFRLMADVAERFEANVHADTEGASVYVVDDDIDNCECIAMALDKMGLRTRYAAKPELAMEHFNTDSSDLIVLDVDLGTMNGFDVHTKLRKLPHLQSTPVLFVSALSSAQAQVSRLGTQQDEFLPKPYTLYGIGLKAMCMIVGARLRA